MATTAKGLRYPTSSDVVDIAGDIQNLATDIDSVVGTQNYSSTTLGTMPVRGASALTTIALGSPSQSLVVSSSSGTGMAWANSTAGAPMSLISSVSASGAQYVLFKDIPQGYRNLHLVVNAAHTDTGADDLEIHFPTLVPISSYSKQVGSSNWFFNTSVAHNLADGDPIAIFGLQEANLNGIDAVNEVPASATNFRTGNNTSGTDGLVITAQAGAYVINFNQQNRTSTTWSNQYNTSGWSHQTRYTTSVLLGSGSDTATYSNITQYTFPEYSSSGGMKAMYQYSGILNATGANTGPLESVAILTNFGTGPIKNLMVEASNSVSGGGSFTFRTGSTIALYGIK